MILGVIGLIILYSPIGSPSYYINQPETLYVQNAGVTSLNSNMSNLPKVSNYAPSSYNETESSEQFVNEPIAQLPSSNFESKTVEMSSNYQSMGGSSNSYTQYSRKSEVPSVSTYPVMPIMSFSRKSSNQTESQGQFTPISTETKSISEEAKQQDAELYANGPSKCHDNPTDCGHWVWVDGYCGWFGWHPGHWDWIAEDCPGVPVGDGTITIIVLLIGYSIFKYYKNEKNKQVLGTK